MKKIQRTLLLFLCGLMCIVFTACGKPKTSGTPDINKLFSTAATITYGDFEAQAKVSRLGSDLWEVEFATPQTLAGVKLSYTGEDITASYLGLSFSIPKTAAPVKSMLTMIFKAVDKSAVGVDMPCEEKDGVMIYSGTGDFGDFTLSMDQATGNLVSFEMPKEDLIVQFADFTPIQ